MYMRRVVLLLVFVRLCFTAQAQEVEKSWRTAVENYNYQEAVELLDQEILQQQDSAKLRSLLLQKAACQKSLYKFQDFYNLVFLGHHNNLQIQSMHGNQYNIYDVLIYL